MHRKSPPMPSYTWLFVWLWFSNPSIGFHKRREEKTTTRHMDLVWETWVNPRAGVQSRFISLAVPSPKRPVPVLRLQHGSGTILVEGRCQVGRRSPANQQCHRWRDHGSQSGSSFLPSVVQPHPESDTKAKDPTSSKGEHYPPFTSSER